VLSFIRIGEYQLGRFNCQRVCSESAHQLKHINTDFWWFKSDDFELKDKNRSDLPKKFEDAELQILDKNWTRTLEESAEALNDYLIVFDYLHTMGKI